MLTIDIISWHGWCFCESQKPLPTSYCTSNPHLKLRATTSKNKLKRLQKWNQHKNILESMLRDLHTGRCFRGSPKPRLWHLHYFQSMSKIAVTIAKIESWQLQKYNQHKELIYGAC